MTLLRCLTCGVEVDPNAPSYLAHTGHELAPPQPTPKPEITRAKIESHLRAYQQHLETLAQRQNPTTMDSRDLVMRDLLEFVLKLERDLEHESMKGMDLR